MRPEDFEAFGLKANVCNPSMAAALAMFVRYWADDPMAPLAALAAKSATWAEAFAVNTLDDIKDAVAAGVPVLVGTGLTPWGHPTAGPTLWTTPLPAVGPHSGILGTVLPYTFPADHPLRVAHLRESVFTTERVAIGYDDDRQRLILHDPSFGPAWEVAYRDFEAMWTPVAAAGAGGPPDYRVRAAARSGAAVYRERSAEERALEQFVFGYALACVGHRTMAIDRYRAGIAIPGVTPGLRHLFLVELALQSTDRDEALALLLEATRLVPESHVAWRILAAAYSRRPLDRVRSIIARFRAEVASRDPLRRAALAEALPDRILTWWPR